MASIEYSSTDVGAPQMGGKAAGSLVNVIKAVLVDGYGDKQPLNWELMFADAATYTYVFRPRSGSRMFLQINDDGSHNVSGYHYMRIIAYENMFSASNGIHPCPSTADVLNNNAGYVYKTTVNSDVVQKWRIVGDDKGFYLLTYPSSTIAGYENRACVYYFGEYVNIGHNSIQNQYNWVMWTYNKNGSSYGCSANNAQLSLMRNPYTQMKGAKYADMGSGFGSLDRSARSSSVSFVAQAGANARNEATINGLPVYSQVWLKATGYDTFCLGVMPGFFDITTNLNYRKEQIFYEDLDENNKIMSTPTALSGETTRTATPGRMAFLIGEKFRHVF